MLTVEALLAIIPACTRSISLGGQDDVPEWQRTSETVEVIDANLLTQALQAIIDERPENVFSALVGMHIRQANEYLVCRSPHERAKNPVKSVTIRFVDSKSPLNDFHSPGPDSGPNAVRLVLNVRFDGKGIAVIESVTSEP